MMIMGFTGTRHQPSTQQIGFLLTLFSLNPPDELHHGACVGSDLWSHRLGCSVKPKIRVVVHPPVDESRMTPIHELLEWGDNITVMPPKPYLDRNKDIVAACDRLVGIPDGSEVSSLHSGTWATIRFAVKSGKPVTICYPDGQTEER